ncbi:sugar phosphate isomerase/epimerase family protein [Companilactobacillus kimchii]|uniref:Xylose isomerase-like TIM barrel domain-containing protein n=2 Tax=Companilactobacillus kimchii TaxID=2801452 RepID=A0ABR5NVI3_9LACO|nr:sugar phosphate isomerase/epimerase [Companilactobacillus kimchii]KAE9558130.1 hypothetical protein ATN91_15225 [Companilactobacillus kimchii]KRK52835.1 hypothetical protein FC97_GL002002 [Companilactobacillus kimchii DSM 13961 = JCM 10707]OWF32962.1 hypothetical protein LKACC12383_01452 [Companilactobacillus kimchii]GEO46921.1 sugar phosphate isomerase [Companilactobacillus paralimentarius]
MKISAELFPVLELFNSNPQTTLQSLGKIGFTGIELYGNPTIDADKLRFMVEQSGLQITGYQVPWRLMQNGGLKDVIKYQKSLHNKHIIIAALGGPWESGHKVSENTISTWKKHALRINEMCKELSMQGMDLTYHTHSYDFGEKVERKETSFEILKQNVLPMVNFEIDSGNCLEGGLYPQKEILKLSGRSPFVHCKPYSKAKRYEIKFDSSLDENDWSSIIEASRISKTKWLVVEPESQSLGTSLEMMEDGFKCINKYI